MPGRSTGKPHRALLVTSVLPWPLHRNGGAQRTDLLRQALERAGYAVEILAVLPQSAPALPDWDELRAHGVVATFTFDATTVIRPRPRLSPPGFGSLWALDHVRRVWRHRYAPHADAARWVNERADRYALVVSRYLQTALVAGLDRRNPVEEPRVLVDLDDVDWLTLESRFRAQPWPGLSGKLGMMIARRTVRQRCVRSLPAFNRLFVTNADDEAELRRLGQSPVLLLNIPYADQDDPERLVPLAPSAPPARDVLFVGDLEFGPNVTGLDWFLDHCWSGVRQEVPDANLRIVGRGLTEQRRQAWGQRPGVDVVGFAENLRSEYERCACTIAPTWWGGGTKIKLVESAALGRACVATPHARRGYDDLGRGPSSPVVTAGDARAFSAAVIDLLLRPASRQAREVAGAVLVQHRYSFPAFARVVAEAVRSAVR